MDRTKELVSDEQLEKAFTNTNYGDTTPREVIKFALLKTACNYHNGYTSNKILEYLGLQTEKLKLTTKGRQYLYDAVKYQS